MAQESRDDFYETLAARGVSRRDFLKWCGSVAAMLGLSEAYAPQIAAAVQKGAALQPVLWIAEGLCTGCTESMAQVDTPDVPTIVLELLSINYWETVMAAAGTAADKSIQDTIKRFPGEYLVVVEGSMMTGFNGNALRIGGKTGLAVLDEVTKDAKAIIAVGSCAVDGGWVRANPNPAGAKGVKDVPHNDKPVINLPTCPVNPEWVVAVVIDYLLLGKLPQMDSEGRPTLIYGQTIHDNCPRRGHFDNGEFVEAFGTEAEKKQYCLYKMGCKGPQTKTNCPLVRWNHRANWCVEAGSPCIGCGNLNWVDNDSPFLQRMPDVAGIRPETIGAAVGGVALAGLVVHGVAQTMTGRMGHGAPVETSKKSDQKGGGE